jgi:hypothetical protein
MFLRIYLTKFSYSTVCLRTKQKHMYFTHLRLMYIHVWESTQTSTVKKKPAAILAASIKESP